MPRAGPGHLENENTSRVEKEESTWSTPLPTLLPTQPGQ